MGDWQSQAMGGSGQNLPPPPPSPGTVPPYNAPPPLPPVTGYGGPAYPPPRPPGGNSPVLLVVLAAGAFVVAGIVVAYATGLIGRPTVIGQCPPDCRPTLSPPHPTLPPPNPTLPPPNPTLPPPNPTLPPNPGDASQLPGLWLSTIDMGGCGQASTLMYFGSDGGWSMNEKSPVVNPTTQCADVSLTGHFTTTGGTMNIAVDPPPYCELYGTCHLQGTLSYQFNTSAAVELCDIGFASGQMGFWGGTCYTFYRQSQ